MYTKQQVSDLFAKSQAILSLPEVEKEKLLEKFMLLPIEGQQAILDILKTEQETIEKMRIEQDPVQLAAQQLEKNNRIIAIEHALKAQVLDAKEKADTNENDLDNILTQLN